jgi:hypothetical protein
VDIDRVVDSYGSCVGVIMETRLKLIMPRPGFSIPEAIFARDKAHLLQMPEH